MDQSETLDSKDAARERLVFGLRMLEGVDRQQFRNATGYEIHELVAEPLRKFIGLGMLEQRGARRRLTREGLMVSDSIWPEFLAD